MAERIPANDLNRRSGEILGRVNLEGQTFEITRHGKVIAVLSPPPDVVDAIDYAGRKLMGEPLTPEQQKIEDEQRAALEGGTKISAGTIRPAPKQPWKSHGGLSKSEQAKGRYDR